MFYPTPESDARKIRRQIVWQTRQFSGTDFWSVCHWHKACIDNPKKSLLNSNMTSICPPNMANFGPLTAEICWRVWDTPANFNGFRVLPSMQRRRSPEANQTLHDVWVFPGLLHYIYTFSVGGGALALDRILPGAKFTLRPRFRC